MKYLRDIDFWIATAIMIATIPLSVATYSRWFQLNFFVGSFRFTHWLSWIGTFDQNGPIGGLAYYLTSPRSLEGVAQDPLRAVTFVIFMVIACVIFARIWVEIGGLGSRQVAKQLLDSQVQVPGFRRSGASVETILSRYIPAVTIVSGIFIGLLASVSDLFGAYGSGTGILLMIDIILNLYQVLMRERVEEMMPTLAGMLGRR